METVVPVTITRFGTCWNSPNAQPTIRVSCKGGQLYSDANCAVPFSTSNHSFSDQLTLYLKASNPSAVGGIIVSAVATVYCSYTHYSSGSNTNSSSQTGHSVVCSKGDIGTAWEVKVTGPDTKVVGQLITMEAQLLPAALKTYFTPEYEWTASGSQPVASYGAPSGKTEQQAMEVIMFEDDRNVENRKKQSVSYYCTGHAGENLAQCRFKLFEDYFDLIDVAKSKVTTIQRPYSKFFSYWANWTTAPGEPPVGVRGMLGVASNAQFLILGGVVSSGQNSSGIMWGAKVNPPIGGEIALCQLVDNWASFTYTAGNSKRYKSSEYELDTSFPAYGISNSVATNYTPITESVEDIIINETYNLYLTDAPGVDLQDDKTMMTLRNDFKTYLLYKPSGGIWVTLELMEWEWHGHAYKNSGVWTLFPSASGNSGGASQDSIELPVWNKNIKPTIYEDV